jgi:hypothetical protein
MSHRKLAVLFAACFALVVIATLPLSVVLAALDLPARGISYTRASGTVWNGELAGLRWRGQDLGGARLAFRPLPLLWGRLGADVELDGKGAVTGHGFVAAAIGGFVVSGLSLEADVAALPILIPVSGRVALTIDSAKIGGDGCERVEGRVRTDALVHRPAGLAWRGPELEGPVTCESGAIVIPLTGGTPSESVAVAMTLGHDGSFGLRVEARTPDAALLSVLSAVGFVETGGVMTLTQRGRWI